VTPTSLPGSEILDGVAQLAEQLQGHARPAQLVSAHPSGLRCCSRFESWHRPVSRGQTTNEFRDSHGGPYWMYYGGLPGDPGWVSNEARAVGDREGLDAEALDDAAADYGWEHHDRGYREAIEQAAIRLKEL